MYKTNTKSEANRLRPAVKIVGRAITKWGAIQKRKHIPI